MRKGRSKASSIEHRESSIEYRARSIRATLRLPRGHPEAIWWLTGRHPEATPRLP